MDNPFKALAEHLGRSATRTAAKASSSPLRPGDAITCPNCGQPRTAFEVNLLPDIKPIVALTDCLCTLAALEALREHDEAQVRETRRAGVEARFGGLALPDALAGKKLSNFEPLEGKYDALGVAQRWASSIHERLAKGQGIIFTGSPGTGKTHLGAALANEVNALGRAAIHASTNRLLERIKNLWGNGEELGRLQRAILDADLLVLEDLGQEVAAERELSYLFGWLDGRYEALASVIITTNLSASALVGRYGEAILSRLRERCKLVEVKGEDYRLRLREDW